jgi:hypothetical protein
MGAGSPNLVPQGFQESEQSSIHNFVIHNFVMKQGSLFCFVLYCNYEIHQTGMIQIMFLLSLESSRGQGVDGLDSMTFGLVVQKFLNSE